VYSRLKCLNKFKCLQVAVFNIACVAEFTFKSFQGVLKVLALGQMFNYEYVKLFKMDNSGSRITQRLSTESIHSKCL
jgi:hypothetical protein